jgi:hypothetical protein
MVSRIKVPQVKNPNIVFRLAETEKEVEAANQLVCANYLDVGLWENEEEFRQNKFCQSDARVTFVMVEGSRVIGTVSVIKDTQNGLPADTFQPEAMRQLRRSGDRLAEISALAVEKSVDQPRALVLFLFKLMYQYSFYYLGIDRFIATTTPKHAVFYQLICGFHVLSAPADYYYVKLGVQLLTAHLVRDRLPLAEAYGLQRELDAAERSFYHFLLVDDHPSLRFPNKKLMRRSRDIDWLAQARLMDMPMAV